MKYHAELAEYFLRQIDPEGNMSLKGAADMHAVSEVAYHLIMAERWSELVNTLTDLRFVELKALLGLVYGLLDDYNEACRDGLKYNGKVCCRCTLLRSRRRCSSIANISRLTCTCLPLIRPSCSSRRPISLPRPCLPRTRILLGKDITRREHGSSGSTSHSSQIAAR